MVMTLRLSSIHRSGSRQIHHGRKKSASSSQQCHVHVDRFSRHPRHCPQGISTPWSNRQWQVLLWGFEAAEGGHSAQTSRQVEEKQLVSPPWQCARSHITRCSTIPDFQKHYSVARIHIRCADLDTDGIFWSSEIQSGARNVIPLIVHVTPFYYYKSIWHLVQN